MCKVIKIYGITAVFRQINAIGFETSRQTEISGSFSRKKRGTVVRVFCLSDKNHVEGFGREGGGTNGLRKRNFSLEICTFFSSEKKTYLKREIPDLQAFYILMVSNALLFRSRMRSHKQSRHSSGGDCPVFSCFLHFPLFHAKSFRRAESSQEIFDPHAFLSGCL